MESRRGEGVQWKEQSDGVGPSKGLQHYHWPGRAHKEDTRKYRQFKKVIIKAIVVLVNFKMHLQNECNAQLQGNDFRKSY